MRKVLVAFVLLPTAVAHAQMPHEEPLPSEVALQPPVAPSAHVPSAPVPERPTTTRWYGASIWLADGLVVASLVPSVSIALGAPSVGAGMLAVSLVGYVLAPAAVHLRHGSVGRGVASVALRVGLPALYGLAGARLEPCGVPKDFCGYTGLAIGAFVGYLSALAIDGTVLAWERRPASTATWSLAPVVGRTSGVALVGVW